MNKPLYLVFDLYGTLFDVTELSTNCENIFPGFGAEFSTMWREKQLHYAFVAELTGTYNTFSALTRQALQHTAFAHDLPLAREDEEKLMADYLNLPPFPEVESVLQELKGSFSICLLSNGGEDMLTPLLANAHFDKYFDHVWSIETVRHYKPSPLAYELIRDRIGHDADILFLSSNCWDIIGAGRFGFKTAWINRNGLPFESIGYQPDHVLLDLRDLFPLLEH